MCASPGREPLLGALRFLSAAIAPSLIVYVAGIGAIGLAFFFTGMAAIPFIESRYAARTPAAGPDRRPGLRLDIDCAGSPHGFSRLGR
jgi:hypothetical protein